MKAPQRYAFVHHEDTKSTKKNKLRVLRLGNGSCITLPPAPIPSFMANNTTGCRDYMPSKLLTVSDSPLRLKHFFLAEAGA